MCFELVTELGGQPDWSNKVEMRCCQPKTPERARWGDARWEPGSRACVCDRWVEGQHEYKSHPLTFLYVSHYFTLMLFTPLPFHSGFNLLSYFKFLYRHHIFRIQLRVRTFFSAATLYPRTQSPLPPTCSVGLFNDVSSEGCTPEVSTAYPRRKAHQIWEQEIQQDHVEVLPPPRPPHMQRHWREISVNINYKALFSMISHHHELLLSLIYPWGFTILVWPIPSLINFTVTGTVTHIGK